MQLEKTAEPEEVDSVKQPAEVRPSFLNGWISITIIGIVLQLVDVAYGFVVLERAGLLAAYWRTDLLLPETPLVWIGYAFSIIGCYGVLRCKHRSLWWLLLPVVFSLVGAGALLALMLKEDDA